MIVAAQFCEKKNNSHIREQMSDSETACPNVSGRYIIGESTSMMMSTTVLSVDDRGQPGDRES